MKNSFPRTFGRLSHGHSRRDAGQSREYRAYYAMRARCLNSNNKEYRRYGGRGISICKEWLGPDGFSNFLAAMGSCPSPDHSLDRIDSDSNYEPSNCRWATILEQVRNRRNTQRYRGKPLAQWAEELGVNYQTFMCRWRAGDRGERLFRPTEPTRQPRATVERRNGDRR